MATDEDLFERVIAATLAGAKAAADGKRTYDEYLAEYDLFSALLKEQRSKASLTETEKNMATWSALSK